MAEEVPFLQDSMDLAFGKSFRLILFLFCFVLR